MSAAWTTTPIVALVCPVENRAAGGEQKSRCIFEEQSAGIAG
jgi:hypothetical protein